MPFLGHSTTHPLSQHSEFLGFSAPIISSFEYLCAKRRSSPPGLGGAPKGQRRLDSILLLVLTVPLFPLSSNDPSLEIAQLTKDTELSDEMLRAGIEAAEKLISA